MTDSKVHLFLEDSFRKSAESGAHNFINLMVDVLRTADMFPVFRSMPPRETGDLSLSHMVNPPDARGLVFRRVYHYPFWQIEAVAQRWHWDVARATFDPADAPPDANRFYRFWQKRLFGDACQNTPREKIIYVPLQGHLDRKRLFQACTPLEMVEACLAHAPTHQIVATLHPGENYHRSEIKQLEALATRHPRLTVDTGNMERHLQSCDFVVTQNSGAAFSAFFFGKAALLFGQIDFHHICVKANMDALGDCFEKVATASPAFAEYVWWFWQKQSINAGRPEAKTRIAERLRRFGWPIPASSSSPK